MLKFFERDGKLNWVDSNNVFVGFSDYQSCCESYGGALYSSIDSDGKLLDIDLESDNDWVFDTSFYTDYAIPANVADIEGNSAGFRLVDGKGNEIFLVIWNEHNGYYAHGFEFCNGDTVIVKGCV